MITTTCLVLLLTGCTKPDAAPVGTTLDATAPPTAEPKGQALGEVMTNVGRRFELLGRAIQANRWELAEYEAGELGEIFEDDLPHAVLPNEGPTAHIPGMAKTFLETFPPLLQKAAATKDAAAAKDAFARTAAACNLCHTASQKAFLEIPSVPGQVVPRVDMVANPPKVGAE